MTIRPMRADELAVGRHAFVLTEAARDWATQEIAGADWAPVVLVAFELEGFQEGGGDSAWSNFEVHVRATGLAGNAVPYRCQFGALFVIEPC